MGISIRLRYVRIANIQLNYNAREEKGKPSVDVLLCIFAYARLKVFTFGMASVAAVPSVVARAVS